MLLQTCTLWHICLPHSLTSAQTITLCDNISTEWNNWVQTQKRSKTDTLIMQERLILTEQPLISSQITATYVLTKHSVTYYLKLCFSLQNLLTFTRLLFFLHKDTHSGVQRSETTCKKFFFFWPLLVFFQTLIFLILKSLIISSF